MRIASYDRNGTPALGIVEGSRILDVAAAGARAGRADVPSSMLALIAAGPEALALLRTLAGGADDPALWLPLAETRLLPPTLRPTKNVFCVGRNYKLHIEEAARARGQPAVFPKVPEFFTKPPTSVIGHDDEILWDPAVTQKLDYEVELAIVIGRRSMNLTRETARAAIFGYTIVNDVSARDLQFLHGIPFKGKGLDTTCPIGPWITTADAFGDAAGKRISLSINGETRQDSSTSDLLFDCDTIVASLSLGMTLEPGDIIATGTPAGVALGLDPPRWLKHGDVIEATVEGIGTLRNTVREAGRS